MYMMLAVFAAIVGLVITGAAVFTAYSVWQLRRQGERAGTEPGAEAETTSRRPDDAVLLRWTVMDYALTGLIAIGLMFLLVDVIGAIRDRAELPVYHYGYLLSGFLFTALGVLFLMTRLFLLLRVAGAPRAAAAHHHDQPDHADHTEQGV